MPINSFQLTINTHACVHAAQTKVKRAKIKLMKGHGGVIQTVYISRNASSAAQRPLLSGSGFFPAGPVRFMRGESNEYSYMFPNPVVQTGADLGED